MNIETYLPTELLKPFIRKYLIIESEDEVVNRVLPDTSLAIAFRFKGQVNYIADRGTTSLPVSVISGLRKSVRLINYLKGTSNLIVLFKETGAAAFFKEPIHKLFEESTSLDNFIARQKITDVEEQLTEARSNAARISVVEKFLLSGLRQHHVDNLIVSATQRIYSAKGNVRIKELASDLCISQDAFEKRFRKIIGTTPKQFSSIVRMKSITNQKQPDQNLNDLAFDAGYFDQPHFNKDFKLFTGQTPTDFFKSPSFW